MPFTSCPRCAQQVSLPPGASELARVRCPHCQSEYTLGEALQQDAPMLEVLAAEMFGDDEEISFDEPDIDAASANERGGRDLADHLAETIDFQSSSFRDIADSLPHDLRGAGAADDLTDDLTMQDQDTEVEELNFTMSEPAVRPVPEDIEEIEIASADDEPEFGEPEEVDLIRGDSFPPTAAPANIAADVDPLADPLAEDDFIVKADAEESAFAEEPSLAAADDADSDEIDLDFGEAEPAQADSFGAETIAFDPTKSGDDEEVDLEGVAFDPLDDEPAPPSKRSLADTMTVDFVEPVEMADESMETLEFQPSDVAAGDDEIELDFGDPIEAPAATAAAGLAALPAGADATKPAKLSKKEAKAAAKEAAKAAKLAAKEAKKSKKGKDKPATPVAEGAEAKPARKRSLVGVLVNFVMPLIVALPIAYYIGLWISKDFDVLGVGPTLTRYVPAAVLPSSLKPKPKTQIAMAPALPPAGLPQTAGNPVPPADAAAEPTNEAPPTPDAAAPAEAVAAEIAPAEPAGDAPPKPMPDASDDAPPAPPEDAAPEAPAATAPATDIAEEMPDEKPEEPAKDDALDALLKDDSPAASGKADADVAAETPAEEMPAEDAPAEEMPDAADEPAKKGDAGDDLDALLLPDGPKAKAEEMPEEAPAADPFEPAEEKPAEKDEKPSELLDDNAPPAPEDPAEPAASPEPAKPEPLGPRADRLVTAAEIDQAMVAAFAASQRMTAAQSSKNEAEIKKARAALYLSLYGLADAITFFDAAAVPPEVANQQRQKLSQAILMLAADPKRYESLKFNAGRWLGYGKRTTAGIALAGTVDKVEHVGKLYYINVKLSPDSPAVTVVSQQDPQLASTDEAITLGHIVDDPSEQLAGYEGTAPSVIWSGMTLKVPKRPTQ